VSVDGTRLDGEVDARNAAFEEAVLAPVVGEGGYVDCTGSVLKGGGSSSQPADGSDTTSRPPAGSASSDSVTPATNISASPAIPQRGRPPG